jgi:hypothetical protein
MKKLNEYKNILRFILLIIEENFPLVIIYLILQLPLFIFAKYSNDIDFIIKAIMYQIWLAVFFFMIYTMKYNITKQLREEIKNIREFLED